jgi:hypothetical protein
VHQRRVVTAYIMGSEFVSGSGPWKAGSKEVMTSQGGYGPRYVQGPKFDSMIPGSFMALGRALGVEATIQHTASP